MTPQKNSIASQYTKLPSARIEALKALAEKVEAGTLDGEPESRDLAESAFGSEWLNVGLAYAQGSLDAAKALQNAVLPGWDLYQVDHEASSIGNGIDEFMVEHKGNAARAWLLAIIKAYISELEA